MENPTKNIESVEKFFTVDSVKYIFAAENNPNRAVVVSNKTGNYQLHAVDFLTNYNRQVTDADGGKIFGSISSNGEYIYRLNNTDGSEHGHFIKEPFDGGGGVDISPESKNYFAYEVDDSEGGKTICFRASIDDKNHVAVSKKTGSEYALDLIYKTRSSLTEAVCSPSGSMFAVGEVDSKSDKERLVCGDTSGETVKKSAPFKKANPIAFSGQDKNKLLVHGAKGGWQRPFFFDIDTGESTFLTHTKFRGDVWVMRWIEEEDKLIVCDVFEARQTLYSLDVSENKLKRIGPDSGSFNYHFGSVAVDDDSFIVRWSDFNTSPRLTSSSSQAGSKLTNWSGSLSTDHRIESVTTPSSDEQLVQLWIVKPKGAESKIPFVLDIHGGPHGVTLNEFSPKALAWVKNGFGYCAVNYRGSTSFGRNFEKQIYGNPGFFEVEDTVAARNWLVNNEYAGSDQVILHGWSWGGYVTLLALGKYPELWAGGVAGSAIGDCVAQYKDEPAYFQAKDQERFGGTPEEVHEQYVKSSPITYAEKIQAPVLLIHGKNDVRCPARQIKNFKNVLEMHEKDVDISWFETGHTGSFTDTRLRIKNAQNAIKFAKRVSGKGKK